MYNILLLNPVLARTLAIASHCDQLPNISMWPYMWMYHSIVLLSITVFTISFSYKVSVKMYNIPICECFYNT